MSDVIRTLRLEKSIYEKKQRMITEAAKKTNAIAIAISDRLIAKEYGISIEELTCQRQ